MVTQSLVFVLIILSPVIGDKKIVTTQEFENYKTCEEAKTKLELYDIKAFCTRK